MNSSYSPGPSLNVLLLWLFIVITILLSFFLIGRTLFSTKPVTDPSDIPDSVFQIISDSLKDDYEFLGYTDDGGIENLDGITFLNNTQLATEQGCGITLLLNDCPCESQSNPSHIFLSDVPPSDDSAINDDPPSDDSASNDDPPQPFLFKFTGTGLDTCQLPIPGDRCTAIMKCNNNDDCGGGGKTISWEYCPD